MLQGEDRYKIISRLLPCNKYGSLFRLVGPDDAPFIYKLRTDPLLCRFVSPVEGSVNDQKQWIIDYKSREATGEEFYILSIDQISGNGMGVNRLYNLNGNSFELGSWLYMPNEDISKSILGDIFTKETGYENLDLDFCTFNVRKANKSVLRYHQGYLPEIMGEDDLNIYFRLSRVNFNKNKLKYLKICGYGQLT
jgi:hypothetical protein